jgi:hypothetical protein
MFDNFRDTGAHAEDDDRKPRVDDEDEDENEAQDDGSYSEGVLHEEFARGVQRREAAADDEAVAENPADVQAIAAEGVDGTGDKLPHLDTIQAAFGEEHDLSGVRAHVGGKASDTAGAIGAEAYATGQDVAFADTPDVHTAAHEATHVVQQQAGVHLKGGVGQPGDAYEREADAVADAVVAGRSAAPLLVSYASPAVGGGAAVQTRALQLDKAKGKNRQKSKQKPSAPKEIPDSDAFAHIKEGQDGKAGLEVAKTKAAALHDVMVLQAKSKVVHEQAKKAYDQATKARERALEKSDLEKVLGAIFTIVELGTSVYGVIKAARTIYTTAKGLQDTYKMYKATGGLGAGIAWDLGKEGATSVVEGGKAGKDGYDKGKELADGEKTLDPDTILADTNHAAITAGHAALSALTEGQIKYGFIDVEGEYRKGALNVAQMASGVQLLTRENKVLSEASLTQYKAILDDCEKLQKDLQTSLELLRATWKAYMAGGAEALADPRERGIFETVQGWIQTGDPKAKSMRFAMDQSAKSIKFKGTTFATGDGIGQKMAGIGYHCHDWESRLVQIEQGTLYIKDPAVVTELKKLLMPDVTKALDAFLGGPGVAETIEDTHGGEKFTISASLCKALMEIGIQGTFTDVTVNLFNEGTLVTKIKSRHSGDWYDRWKDAPEFQEFWKTSLGGKWAFIKEGRKGKKEKVPTATEQDVERSTHVPNNRMPM